MWLYLSKCLLNCFPLPGSGFGNFATQNIEQAKTGFGNQSKYLSAIINIWLDKINLMVSVLDEKKQSCQMLIIFDLVSKLIFKVGSFLIIVLNSILNMVIFFVRSGISEFSRR